jgi:serine protease AprX
MEGRAVAPARGLIVHVRGGYEAAAISTLNAVEKKMADAPPLVLDLVRRHRIQQMRNEFERVVSPFRAFVENSTARSLEGRRSPALKPPQTRVQLCWLNNTMRAPLVTGPIAEIAADATVQKIDLPHPLALEEGGTPAMVVQKVGANAAAAEIVVAVIDGEVDVAHPCLKGRVIHKRNLTVEPWGIPSAHATAVASLIASNDGAHQGVAPGATIFNYKVFPKDSVPDDFDGSVGIQSALEDGVRVANCSWGAGAGADGTSPAAIACDTAWANGMLVVKSAGNLGPGAGTLTTPADANGVVVVGATRLDGLAVADYSSRGPTSDGRHRPHVVAVGADTTEAVVGALLDGSFGDVGWGTSYAAPLVAGVLARLVHAKPHLTTDQIRDLVTQSCAALVGVDVDTQGAGVLSP